MVSKKTIITIGTVFLVVIFSVSIFLPIFLNYQSKIEIKEQKKINIEKFFKDKSINQDISTNVSIIDKIDKNIILEKLTNFNDISCVENFQFNEQSIENNLINTLKNQIIEQTGIKDESLFMQVRYDVYNKNNLIIDVRWIDKTNHLFLYYDKNVIKLNNKIIGEKHE